MAWLVGAHMFHRFLQVHVVHVLWRRRLCLLGLICRGYK